MKLCTLRVSGETFRERKQQRCHRCSGANSSGIAVICEDRGRSEGKAEDGN